MAILKRALKGRFLVIFAALFIGIGPAGAAVQLQEQKIKAGLLYNFVKYTSWPQSSFAKPDDPFQICLLGGDSFEGALDPLQGRTAQKRSINILKIYEPDSLSRCHVAFIHRSQKENIVQILDAVRGQPVLLLSDIDDFSRIGGMVEFSNPTQKRIQLYLNKHDIESAGLFVGDPLLKLAQLR